MVNSHVNNESNLHATLVVCNSCEDKDKLTFFTFLKGVGGGGAKYHTYPRMERQWHLRNYPCTKHSSNPTLTITSHSGQNVGLSQGEVGRCVVNQNLRLTRTTREHQSHPNYYYSSRNLCTALSLWAYTGGATTIYLRKAYKIKHNNAKKVGGNRDWTSDLSICSRMLYHWAMPPFVD